MPIKLVLLVVVMMQVSCLTGQAAQSYCHCDLTASFCDVNCCCDSDCSSTISVDCANRKSKSYCPDPTFFSRIGSTYLTASGCYYYNSTNTVIEQVAISSPEITHEVNINAEFSRVSISAGAPYTGYMSSDVLAIGGTSNFNLISSTGDCLTGLGAATQFSIKIGATMQLRCKCTTAGCTSALPALFTAFSGKNINAYKGDTTHTLTTPTFSDATITSIQLNFIIGSFGSQKVKYIERITSSTSSTSSTERILNIVFIQPYQVVQTTSSPTFFPQIPQDMFYPIYLLA